MKKRWIAIVLPSTGCATVMKRPGEPIAVDSKPSGAEVVIQCSNFALLPGITLALFLSPGRAEDTIAAVAAGGAGLSGVFGFVIDRTNGRAYRHFPDEINERLDPIK